MQTKQILCIELYDMYVYDTIKMSKRINCWTINSLYYAMNTLPYHIKKRIQIPVLHRLYIFLLAGFVA